MTRRQHTAARRRHYSPRLHDILSASPAGQLDLARSQADSRDDADQLEAPTVASEAARVPLSAPPAGAVLTPSRDGAGSSSLHT